MQNKMQLPLHPHHFAADFYVIAFRRLRAEVSANTPVDRDSSGRDQLIAMSSRSHASRGEEAIQAHRLSVGFGLGQADDFCAFLPLPALLQQLHALEALQNISFCRDGAGAFKTAMLGHSELLRESEREQ